jgi:hypothetical protein
LGCFWKNYFGGGAGEGGIVAEGEAAVEGGEPKEPGYFVIGESPFFHQPDVHLLP